MKFASFIRMHIEHLAPLLPIFLLLVLTPIIRVMLLGRAADKVSYERAYRLFSPAERSFLGVLDQTLAINTALLERCASLILFDREGVSRLAREPQRSTGLHLSMLISHCAIQEPFTLSA